MDSRSFNLAQFSLSITLPLSAASLLFRSLCVHVRTRLGNIPLFIYSAPGCTWILNVTGKAHNPAGRACVVMMTMRLTWALGAAQHPRISIWSTDVPDSYSLKRPFQTFLSQEALLVLAKNFASCFVEEMGMTRREHRQPPRLRLLGRCVRPGVVLSPPVTKDEALVLLWETYPSTTHGSSTSLMRSAASAIISLSLSTETLQSVCQYCRFSLV